MTLQAKEIPGNYRYRHLKTISYNEIIPFILEYIKKCTLPVILSGIIMGLSLVPVIIIRIEIAGVFPWYMITLHSLAGLLLMPFILIVPHEMLHIIPYYISGARDIRIGANLEEGYFYVTAHKHPVNRKWFTVIALSPMIVITLTLLVLINYIPPLWQWSTAIAIFIHITMSAGDIALLSFFHHYRNKKIITWDDADRKEALFYEEIESLKDSE